VTVTTLGGVSAAGAADRYVYTAPPRPALTKVSPASGTSVGGTSVTITGTNLAGATQIDFGPGYPGGIAACSATRCSSVAPPGAGTVDITVTTPGGTSAKSAADRFSYTRPPAPRITRLTPAGGLPGTQVTITGTNLAGATQIDFGAGYASDQADCTQNSCTTDAPLGPTGTVDVSVSTPGGRSAATLAGRFHEVAPPAPAISGVTPAIGPGGGGTSVTINGTNLADTYQIDFGSISTGTPFQCTDTSCTATAPAGNGTVDITVQGPGGTSPAGRADRFTYTSPGPVVASLTPSSGPPAGGTQVTIVGTGFSAATAVSFGAVPARSFTVINDSHITAITPPDSNGTTVDVTVTTPVGTSATRFADEYTYLSPPAFGYTPLSPVRLSGTRSGAGG
jgi:hypothetical protein